MFRTMTVVVTEFTNQYGLLHSIDLEKVPSTWTVEILEGNLRNTNAAG